MAVGLQVLKNYHPVDGVKIGIAQAGIKYVERDDLVLFELAEGSRVAGVFTTNQFCAAPVRVCQKHLAENSPRYLIVNTGNSCLYHQDNMVSSVMPNAPWTCMALSSTCCSTLAT